jgi:hypothetical protein
MALGSVTVHEKGVLAPGGLRFVLLEVQPTSGANYTANGESLPLSTFKGFRKKVVAAFCQVKAEADGSESYIVDPGNGVSTVKLVAMASDGTEATASADLSAKRVFIFALGK